VNLGTLEPWNSGTLSRPPYTAKIPSPADPLF